MSNPRPISRRRRFIRATLLVLLLAGTCLALAVTYRRVSGNLGTVIAGRVYRSAQLSPAQLTREIARHKIRTVLNLRGPNPDQDWYNREVEASLASGVEHISLSMASDQWMSRDQVRTLLDVLDRAEYPWLVHCEFGAERTGLVSAVIALMRPGSKLSEGLGEFTPGYLFLPVHDGLVMLGHIREYEAWLQRTGQAHAPGTLRHWLLTEYTPGTPSREYWQCDPYPRRVVCRPAGGGLPEREEEWTENACPRALSDRGPSKDARRQ